MFPPALSIFPWQSQRLLAVSGHCCSSGAVQLPQALLKCSCLWGGTEWPGPARDAVLLQELQLETEWESCSSSCLGLCPLHQLSFIAVAQ